jgi:hypothetical protein
MNAKANRRMGNIFTQFLNISKAQMACEFAVEIMRHILWYKEMKQMY